MDLPSTIALVCVIACFGGILWLAKRARTIFVVVVREGRVVTARGRLAPTMLHDLEDVFRATRSTGRVTAYVARGALAIDAPGLSENAAQRVRNVVGVVPLPRLRTAPKR
jgi:hypothetical protein